MKPPGTRGYLIAEETELEQQHMTQALDCLGALCEGAQPTAEQWSGMFYVLSRRSFAICESAEFFQTEVVEPVQS